MSNLSVVKFLLLIIAASSIAACQSLSSEPIQVTSTFCSKDYHVGLNEVQAYLDLNNKVFTKASNPYSIEPVVYRSDTVFYIVNYGKGWEVLSGDKRAPRVLIQCDGGSITKADLYSSPAQSAFMEALETNMSKALHDEYFYSDADISNSWLLYADSTDIKDRIILNNERITQVPRSVVRTVIQLDVQDHLLSTKWGQGSPWNSRAPYTDSTRTVHCYTGCTQVAAAQILYYLHYKIGKPVPTYGISSCNAYIPTGVDSLILSPTDITFSYNAPLHWADMPLTSSSSGQPEKVSTLMMRIGYLYNAEYSEDGTSSDHSNAVTVFPSEFSISCSYLNTITSSQIASISRSQIYNNQLPIQMSVSRYVEDEDEKKYHSIILDGYKYLKENVTYTIVVYDLNGIPYIETNTVTEISRFLAINWGWNGTGDSDALGNTIWYDISTPWIVSNYNYTGKNSIVYNFAAIN